VAEEAERYDDVVAQIKSIISEGDGRLTLDERNLLSVAYKNLTNVIRNSQRAISSLERVQASRFPDTNQHLILMRHEKAIIEADLAKACQEIVDLLDTFLLPAATSEEESIFCLKMKGDYYRYLAEFSSVQDREKNSDFALNSYKAAYKLALSTMGATHPTRLGLALNFSVFYHDVWNSPERACHLAKYAFDDAIEHLAEEETASQAVRDAVMILQLLKDNIILWSVEMYKDEPTSPGGGEVPAPA